MTQINQKRLFWTVGQIAELFQVDNATVRRWLRDGEFPHAIKSTNTEKGRWRVPLQDIVARAERFYGEHA